MSVRTSKAVGTKIEIMEKKIVYLRGWRREMALKEYRKLILPELEKPIFLKRSE